MELIPSAHAREETDGVGSASAAHPRALTSQGVLFPLLHLGQFQHPLLLSDCLSHFYLLFLLKADLNK